MQRRKESKLQMLRLLDFHWRQKMEWLKKTDEISEVESWQMIQVDFKNLKGKE